MFYLSWYFRDWMLEIDSPLSCVLPFIIFTYGGCNCNFQPLETGLTGGLLQSLAETKVILCSFRDRLQESYWIGQKFHLHFSLPLVEKPEQTFWPWYMPLLSFSIRLARVCFLYSRSGRGGRKEGHHVRGTEIILGKLTTCWPQNRWESQARIIRSICDTHLWTFRSRKNPHPTHKCERLENIMLIYFEKLFLQSNNLMIPYQ